MKIMLLSVNSPPVNALGLNTRTVLHSEVPNREQVHEHLLVPVVNEAAHDSGRRRRAAGVRHRCAISMRRSSSGAALAEW